MKRKIVRTMFLVGIMGVLCCCGTRRAQAQAEATVSRGLQISAFGGLSGVFTGLGKGRNIALTGGLDAGFRPFFGILPAVELRGMYPLASGLVDNQRNILGGLRLEKRRRALRVYGDVLFGRGEIEYLNGGYLNPAGDYRYQSSTGNVFSPGVGVSVDAGSRWSVFVDAQFQRYDTPVSSSGTLWSKPLTAGVVYRLPFLKHGRPY